MGRLRKRLREIWHAPTVGPAEVILSLTAIAYGAGLLLPRDEFAIYRSQGEMATNVGENVWGLMFLIVGMIRLGSIFTAFYAGRTLTTMISIGLWLYLSVSFLTASPLNPRVMVLFVWALCESWTLLRIRHRE